jgi:1-phosphofructokinase family hexose kinase
VPPADPPKRTRGADPGERKVILTVTLNAAVDRTVAVPNFRLARRHRAVESRTVAGGKGINVARALSLLGRPVIAAGFVGGPTGTRLLQQLREESVLTDFTRIAAETRINLAVIDPTSGDQTEINERGPAVSPEEVKKLFERIGYLAGGAKICVLAGSLPPGAGDDLYARLIADLGRRGVPVVLDAEGEAMMAGVRAGASMVTPNEREAEELVGQEFADGGDLATGLLELVRLGAGEAAITRPEGCVAAVGEGSDRRLLEIHTEPLEPVSTVGSGDAFLAGYVAARYEGRAAEDCLAYGVACGAESTQHFGAGTVDRNQVERLLGEVAVHDLEVPAEV